MTCVPPSSFFSGSVSGSVAVSNFPADQLVHLAAALAVTGPLTDAQLRATPVPVDASAVTVPVSGPLTNAQLIAAEPLSVTGPLTDAQLAARLPLSVSGPLTNAQLIALGLATEATLDRVKRAANDIAFPADTLGESE